ncbi:hypothetical protein HYH03_008866 [Edaphochlamys debaryana]|uniref:FAS1 domain-containing protein n=1 Tax=Edaphochlamys debaryana TaxID=47281 RepID=A0A836BZ28_9CHLO|nr:hypothetical protein HYH03_008866 [Edaphochlamys debaryana]|eukprot:KAG2492958.1 hypothetical protein HYH03_008866 [Edaphochlamys debaryana]
MSWRSNPWTSAPAAAIVAGLLQLCAGAHAQSYATIYDVVVALPELSTLASWVNALGMQDTFKKTNTAFLPNNAALDKLQTSLGFAAADTSALLLNTSALGNVTAQLLKYHLARPAVLICNSTFYWLNGTESTGTGTLASLGSPCTYNLTNEAFGDGAAGTNYIYVYKPNSNLSDVRVKGLRGANATVTTADIAAGNSSFVNVIDTALQFWYDNINDALANSFFSSSLTRFRAAAGSSPEVTALFADPNTRGAVLAADDAAFAATFGLFGGNPAALSAADNLTLVQYSTLAYPWQGQGAWVGPTVNGNQVPTLWAGQPLSFQGPNYWLNRFRLQGSAGTATVFVGYGTAYVHQMTSNVMLPVATNVYDQLRTMVSMTAFVAALDAEVGVRSSLQNPASTFTVFAPITTGFAALQVYSGRPWEQQDGNTKAAILKTTVVSGRALTTTDLPGGTTLYDTMDGSQTLVVTKSATGSPIITVNGKQILTGLGNGRIVVPANEPVAYGKSYIQAIDLPPIPGDVSIPTPGAAAAAAPSALALLAVCGAALLLLL